MWFLKPVVETIALGAVLLPSLCVADNPVTTTLQQYAPMQLHLAYAGDTGMRVSWNTFSKLQLPTVFYGLNPYLLTQVATSFTSVTYQTSETYNNHVLISNLTPDTTYYYRPEFGNQTFSFKTSRPAGDESPFVVAAIVDMGTFGPLGLTDHVGQGAGGALKPGEQTTIDSLSQLQSQYDFVIHPGDIAYADYWLKEEIQHFLPNTTIADGYKVYEDILNAFYDQFAVVTQTKPYMVGPGNHEANCDNGGTTDKARNITYTDSICMPGQTNFTGYRNHFRMPSDVSGGTENFWYSFDHGLAHFVMVDTETDLDHYPANDANSGPFNYTMDAQSDWLRGDLAAVDRSRTPWVVVMGHRPWYIQQANKTSSVCTSCKNVFEPLFHQYGVDLYLSGHVHAYQRNKPIYNGKADPNGLNNPNATWYITNGAAGHYDGLDALRLPLDSYVDRAFNDTYGWSRLTFHNCTHLTQDFIASANNSVLDTATLFKNRQCKPSAAPQKLPI